MSGILRNHSPMSFPDIFKDHQMKSTKKSKDTKTNVLFHEQPVLPKNPILI